MSRSAIPDTRLRADIDRPAKEAARRGMLTAIGLFLLRWHRKRVLSDLSLAQLADTGIPEEYYDPRNAADPNAATHANLMSLR